MSYVIIYVYAKVWGWLTPGIEPVQSRVQRYFVQEVNSELARGQYPVLLIMHITKLHSAIKVKRFKQLNTPHRHRMHAAVSKDQLLTPCTGHPSTPRTTRQWHTFAKVTTVRATATHDPHYYSFRYPRVTADDTDVRLSRGYEASFNSDSRVTNGIDYCVYIYKKKKIEGVSKRWGSEGTQSLRFVTHMLRRYTVSGSFNNVNHWSRDGWLTLTS